MGTINISMKFLQYIKENIIAYHGSDEKFSEFENKKSKSYVGLSEIDVERNAFFFTTNEKYAKEYGKNVIKVSLNLGKSLNSAEDKTLSKILFPLLEKTKTGWFWSDGYSSDQIPNLSVLEDPLEKTHWLKNFKDSDGNFYWTIFDEPNVVELIKSYGFDSAKVREDNGEISIAIFDKDNIKII